MEIARFCGKERLSGGERRWRRLARAVGFQGRLEVYGYGVHGLVGQTQRLAERRCAWNDGTATLADFSPGLIRVWVRCSCMTVDELPDRADEHGYGPIICFAHELGHHRMWAKHGNYFHENVAERFGRLLLASVP